jgi:hypothetical protein
MALRKADFQMSMGMIVAVVFAIILLSLAITWIQGLFGSITDLTYKTTEVAQEKLLKELAETGDKVGIAAPTLDPWAKGKSGSYTLGIRNDDADNGHTFYINAYLTGVGGALSGRTVASVQTEYKVNEWLTLNPRIKDIGAGISDKAAVIIQPKAGTSAGIYTFTIAVCKGNVPDNEQTCHASDKPGATVKSTNLYGSVSFALEIKD